MTKKENLNETETQPCTLLRRFGIMLYDGLLLFSVLLFAVIPVLFLTGGEAVEANNYFFRTYMLMIIALYYLFPWCRNGQTLAMQTWRVKVVQENGEKDHVSTRFDQVFIRLTFMGNIGYWFFLVFV